MGEQGRVGAVVPVVVEVAKINDLLTHWHHSTLSTYDAAVLLQRAARHLTQACWCDLQACCPAHVKHVEPHKNCVLR